MPRLSGELSWSALSDWLDAADPGALRRYHAARTALAALTAWLIMRLSIGMFADGPMPAVGLFAVTVCFIDALVIVDARRAERQVTLLLSLVMFAAALFLASLLKPAGWWYPVLLLALIFVAYVARRRGLRPGELAMILTMGLYFAVGSRATWDTLLWFQVAATVGVTSLWLWQFVIVPYDPARSLRKSVRALFNRAASIVGLMAVGLEDGPAPADDAWEHDLQRRLGQLKRTRRAIESLFPGVLAPGAWTEVEISQLQVALYTAEQGLAQMIEGASDASHLAAIPAEIRMPLGRCLRLLQEALGKGSTESLQTVAAESSVLRAHIREYAALSALDDKRRDLDTPFAPWVVATVRLVSGSYQVAQSVGQVRALQAHKTSPGQKAEVQAAAEKRNSPGMPPLVRFVGNLHLHPTTALGIQAVAATGLAMLVARLLNMDHSNWVFWTAFVVIAGSTGESLRKMMMRVLGTVAGATIGVALALLTPDNTVFIVFVATVCIFLTIYSSPISYPQMVFWLNIGFVMVYTRLGAQEFDLLFARPLTTFLGASVAALVVVFLVPVRTTDRFKLAVSRFLGAVDEYVGAFVAVATHSASALPVDAAHAKVAATYLQVEQTLPGVAFENNPLLQAQSPLTQRATQLAALESEVARLSSLRVRAWHGVRRHGSG